MMSERKSSEPESTVSSSTSESVDSGVVLHRVSNGVTGKRGTKFVKGLSLVTASLFIFGQVAGTGILALPYALSITGWMGVLIIIAIASVASFCGLLLSRSWIICKQLDPSLALVKLQAPYSAIANAAFGKIGLTVTSITLCVQLFSCSVLYLILSSQLLHQFFSQVFPSISSTSCQWMLILGCCLAPFTLLGSPVNYWPVALFAMSSTAVASVLIIISSLAVPQETLTYGVHIMMNDSHVSIETKSLFPTSFLNSGLTPCSFLSALCMIIFSLSGASVLPTVQNDMKNEHSFKHSIGIAYSLMLAMYLAVATVGYATFGDSVVPNITVNLQNFETSPVLISAIQMLLCIHCSCALVISINPVNLTIESFAPSRKNWVKFVTRCLIRLIIISLVIFTAQTIRNFDKLMSVIGATISILQSYIFPVVFYLRLTHLKSEKINYRFGEVVEENEYKHTKCYKSLLGLLLMACVAVSVVSTLTTTVDLLKESSFTPPCHSWL